MYWKHALCAMLWATNFVPLISLAQTYRQADETWQYSVPMESGTERRAYLWIPPRTQHLRGVMLGLQNMLERPMLEDRTIRASLASVDMGVVWISPGAWPGKLESPEQPGLGFSPKEDAIAGVQRVLTDLAKESGYTELKTTPLLVTGHSAAMPFVWGMAAALPDRVIAALPYKGVSAGAISHNVPTLYVAQEWAEWGKDWGEGWQADLRKSVDMRGKDADVLLGDLVDFGSGHFDWHSDAADVISMFIRKAARYRLPASPSQDGPVVLTPITATSGVLVDSVLLGTAEFRAVPYSEWHGDPQSALWYFDREMAEAVHHYMETRLQRQPQAIDFMVDGKPTPLLDNGFAVIKPVFLDDGIRFRVHAEPLTVSPTLNLYHGQHLGHSNGAIYYRVSSGALKQTGPDTFEVAARAGGLARQGLPWEPWIMAYQPGDGSFRGTDKPAHILIDIRNHSGKPQIIQFRSIPNVTRRTKSLALHATASSGLPVQLYVESGPAFIEGQTLHLLPIPPRSKYPVRVIVSAYQWGRVGKSPIQSAGPITREFFIEQ